MWRFILAVGLVWGSFALLTGASSHSLSDEKHREWQTLIRAGTNSTQYNYRDSDAQLYSYIALLRNSRILILNSRNLTEIPAQIWRFRYLRSLDLTVNLLQALPPEIGLLNNLVQLDLDTNHLSHLPPEIGGLSNLA